jgi:hypothetical protein
VREVREVREVRVGLCPPHLTRRGAMLAAMILNRLFNYLFRLGVILVRVPLVRWVSSVRPGRSDGSGCPGCGVGDSRRNRQEMPNLEGGG